jgi:hypothetical protein
MLKVHTREQKAFPAWENGKISVGGGKYFSGISILHDAIFLMGS